MSYQNKIAIGLEVEAIGIYRFYERGSKSDAQMLA